MASQHNLLAHCNVAAACVHHPSNPDRLHRSPLCQGRYARVPRIHKPPLHPINTFVQHRR